MKPSLYSKLIEYSPENTFLFSTLYKTLIRLDYEKAELWKFGEYEKVFNQERLINLKKKYLVADQIDEFPRAYHYLLNPPGLPKTLYVTVVVTMQCNMGCIYCHELGQLGSLKMSNPVAIKTSHYISHLAKEGGHKRIILYFYGGEPLMNLEAMEMVAKTIAKNTNIPTSVTIPSNGLLLDELCIEKLIVMSNDIHLQITLDGPSLVHNSRRPKHGRDSSSYEQVLRAITKAANHFRVTIRTNVDKGNVSYIPDFLDDLIEKNLLPKRVQWYAFPVSQVIGANPHINKKVFSDAEWAEIADSIWKAQVNRNIPLDNMEPGDGLCGIQRRSVLTVDCSGRIYPCTGLHSRTEKVPDTIYGKKISWASKRNFDFPQKCQKCSYFPYCGGGCKAHSAACSSRDSCPVIYFEDILPTLLRYKYRLF